MTDQPISVLGAGAWGTTLALVLAKAGRRVRLWAHRAEHVAEMVARGENPRSLPGQAFPPTLTVTPDLPMGGLILIAVPSQAVRALARRLAPTLAPDAIVVSCTKGLEVDTHLRLSRVIVEEIPTVAARVCALSGPNLASEIAAGLPATSVVAAEDQAVAVAVRERIMFPTLRIYTSTDLTGVELGGALKNIIALGAGISDGLGAGDNAKAAFICRGLAEITRLGVAAGAHPLTFAGLAGVGDLIATCASPLSRNRRLGERLARGQSLEAAIHELGQVAEGVPTTRAARQLAADLGVEMPITEQLHQVLFEGKPLAEAIMALMTREPRAE